MQLGRNTHEPLEDGGFSGKYFNRKSFLQDAHQIYFATRRNRSGPIGKTPSSVAVKYEVEYRSLEK
jgi:hypothetical protein